MPSVGDLDRGRRAGAGALGECSGPVAADYLGTGMRAQPGRQGVRLPVREQVDGRAGIDIDQQRAVGVAAAEREVVELPRYRGKWTYPDLGIIPTAEAVVVGRRGGGWVVTARGEARSG